MDEEEVSVWVGVVDNTISDAPLDAQETLFMDELVQRIPENAVVAKYATLLFNLRT